MVEPTGRQATLFVRPDLPGPTRRRREQLTARLQRLREDGVLDTVTVETWAKQRPVGEDDRYAAFAAWAVSAGVSLAPCFRTRRCYEPGTTDRREYRVRPAICLVVTDECGEIDAVYPHFDGGPRSVRDGLAALGQGTRRSPGASDPGLAD